MWSMPLRRAVWWRPRGLLLSAALVPTSLFGLNPRGSPFTQYTRTVWTQAQGLPAGHDPGDHADRGRLPLALGPMRAWRDSTGYDFVTFTKDNGSLPEQFDHFAARRTRWQSLDRHSQRTDAIPRSELHHLHH